MEWEWGMGELGIADWRGLRGTLPLTAFVTPMASQG
jgi:hypothetical protein